MSKKIKFALYAFGILCIISVIMAVYEENFWEKFYEIDLKIETNNIEQKTEKLYILPEFSTGYMLQITASGATEITIWSQIFSWSTAQYEILLHSPRTHIDVIAKNPKYTTEKEIIIQRPLSAEEQAEIERKEKEKKILEEMWTEENKKIEAEKKKLTEKYEQIAKNGYEYEIKSKLHDMWFVQIDSWFVTAPDDSKQVSQTFEKKEEEFIIQINLTGSYDWKSHYYAVNVKHISE